MKNIFTFLFIIIAFSLSFSRMTLIITLEKTSNVTEDVINNVISSIKSVITESNRFIVLNEEEYEFLELEYSLIYIFNVEGVIPDLFIDKDLELRISLSNLSYNRYSNRKNYILNNDFGEFILTDLGYERVEIGKYYSYDKVEDAYYEDIEKGNYVKTLFGEYYRISNFYSYYPHYENFLRLNLDIKTNLYDLINKKNIYTDNYTISVSEKLNEYFYDKEMKNFERINFPEKNIYFTFQRASENRAKNLSNALNQIFPIYSSVININKDRIYLSSGKEDGVKNNYIFKINEDIYVKVKHTYDFYSEAEIVRKRYDSKININDLAKEYFGFYNYIPANLGLSYGNEFNVILNYRNTDIYGKTKYLLGVTINPLENNIFRSLDTGFSIYSNKYMNSLIKFGTNFESFYTGIQLNVLNNIAFYTDYFIVDNDIRFGIILKIFD